MDDVRIYWLFKPIPPKMSIIGSVWNNQITFWNKDFKIKKITMDATEGKKEEHINVNLELGKLRN